MVKKSIRAAGSLAARHKKMAAAVAVLVATVATPAFAIFGIGDIVFDPSAYATLGSILSSNASMLEKTIAEYNQIVKIYSTNMAMYEHAQAMAQRFSGGQRTSWETIGMQQVNDYTKSRAGETIAWPTMVNGRPEFAVQAWQSASVSVKTNPLHAQEQLGSPTLSSLATTEIMDGSAAKCLATIAQYRANAEANAQSYNSLRRLQFSDADSANSHIQQLNLINASNAQAAAEQLAQGAIRACQVEQQVLAGKVQRDQIAEQLNYATDVQHYAASDAAGIGGTAASFAAFRMP